MQSILKNNRIGLRAIEPSDLETLLSWENNPEYWRVSNTLTPFSKDLLQQYVNSAQDIYGVKQIRLMINLNQTNQSIGAVDLFDFEPRHQRAGIGILIDTSFRRKGFASESLELTKKYASDIVGIRNLSANILEDNKASISLFEKAGFEKVGHRKNWFNDNGKWIDELIYQCKLV